MSAPRLAGIREPGLRRAGAQTGGGTGTGTGSTNAADITIADAGNHFAAGNVEGALAELASASPGGAGAALVVDLASNATGKGASTIGVENAADWLGMGGTDVEHFLVVTSNVVQALNDAIQIYPSNAHSEGASLIGIEDAANKITATTVEGALAELAAGRVKSADLISQVSGNGSGLVGYSNPGSAYPPIAAATVQDVLGWIALGMTKVSDLASNSNAKGAYLVGIEDAAGKITATTVEGALAELALASPGVTTVPLTKGGTGQITAPAAFDALSIKAPDIASAATIDLSLTGCPGNYVIITGATGPVTSLGTAPAGVARVLRFASTPTLTHNAVSLILPGAANIAAAAGDVMFVHSLGAGNWRCTSYMRASSLAALAADLASTAAALGAALIGIQDAAGLITATNVEGALAELAGAPRLLPATLTDASVSVTTSTGSELTLPAATLTANRTITINAGSAAAGEVLRIIRRDATAFTLAIVNGGVGGGTMYTFPVSVARVADFQWDGTNWALAGHSRIS